MQQLEFANQTNINKKRYFFWGIYLILSAVIWRISFNPH